MMRWRSAIGVCLLWVCPGAHAALNIDVAKVAMNGLSAEGIRLLVPETDGAPGQLHVDLLRYQTRRWRRITLKCRSLSLAQGHVRCRDGRLSGLQALAAGRVEFDYDTTHASGELAVVFADGGRIQARRERSGAVHIQLHRLSLPRALALAQLKLDDWQLGGQLDGSVRLARSGVSVDLTLKDGAFSDTSGMHAGEGLSASVKASLAPQKHGSQAWQLNLAWQTGEAFWTPVLFSSGWSLAATGRLRGQQLHVESGRLAGPGLAEADFSARVDMNGPSLTDANVRVDGADLAQLVPQFVLPLVLPEQQSRWRVAGSASGRVQWRAGQAESAQVNLHDVGFSYLGQRFRVGPLNGTLPWHREQPRQVHLDVGGLHWQKLDFEPFALMADVMGRQLTLLPTRLPVLDGAIIIDALSLGQTASGWRGSGRLYSEPISLAKLTTALELPEMAGTLSVAIPGIEAAPERIGLDGTLVISVFDGYLQATGLEVTDPFGLLPRLTANLNAEHLDLEQLTQTFSFGSVSGFIDARVNELLMAGWKPLRFDAEVRSSPGSYRRRISQRAVENITALGGQGAMAAIQRSMLGVFNDFGYREIGVSCRLRGNVCQMSGLDGAGAPDAPFMLVRGGGIPGLNVIGYNRRVDWAELIDRLLNATAGDAEPIVK